MASCYKHPGASPVSLPGDPGVMVCPRCPTVVSGEPKSWNRAGTRLQRNQPKHAGNAPVVSSGCLPLIGLVLLAILAVLAQADRDSKPARESNTTSLPSLTIYWQVITWLVKEDLATAEWQVSTDGNAIGAVQVVRITDKGRELVAQIGGA